MPYHIPLPTLLQIHGLFVSLIVIAYIYVYVYMYIPSPIQTIYCYLYVCLCVSIWHWTTNWCGSSWGTSPPPRLLWLPVILCVVLRPHRHFPFTWACLSVSSMFSSQLGSHVEATSWELFLTSPGGMSHSKLPISGSCGLAASSTGIFSEPWASVGVFCRVGLASTTLHFDWLWLVIFFFGASSIQILLQSLF